MSDIVQDMDDDGFPELLFSHALLGPGNRPSVESHDANIVRVGFGPERAITFEQTPFEYTYFDRNTLGWRPEAISSFDVDNDGLHELMTTHLGGSRGEGSFTNRESQLFTSRLRPGQGAGDRFADADLLPCRCTTTEADLGQEGAPVALFEVQGEDCRVLRVDLDVQASSGDGRPAALDLISPAEDTARLLPHGQPLPEGRWRPEALSGLARFEGAAALGQWRLISHSPACDPGDEACPVLHRLHAASLSLNCAPPDPFGDLDPAPNCANDTDPGGLPESACAWVPVDSLSGNIAADDSDIVIVEGPVQGGFPLDALVSLRVSVAHTLSPPLISLGLHGARRPLVIATDLGPDGERPGFKVWAMALRIDEALAGRTLSVSLRPSPLTEGALEYTLSPAQP